MAFAIYCEDLQENDVYDLKENIVEVSSNYLRMNHIWIKKKASEQKLIL